MKYIISESLLIPATVLQIGKLTAPSSTGEVLVDSIVNDAFLGMNPLFPEETVHAPLDVNPDIK